MGDETMGESIFAQSLCDIEGEPICSEEKDAETGEVVSKPVTLGTICIRCLLAQMKGDEGEDGKQKLERYKLAQRVRKDMRGGKPLKLTSERKQLILKRAEKMFSTEAYASTYQMLEGVNFDDEDGDCPSRARAELTPPISEGGE